jgi:hypothetical protein
MLVIVPRRVCIYACSDSVWPVELNALVNHDFIINPRCGKDEMESGDIRSAYGLTLTYVLARFASIAWSAAEEA